QDDKDIHAHRRSFIASYASAVCPIAHDVIQSEAGGVRQALIGARCSRDHRSRLQLASSLSSRSFVKISISDLPNGAKGDVQCGIKGKTSGPEWRYLRPDSAVDYCRMTAPYCSLNQRTSYHMKMIRMLFSLVALLFM